MPAPADISQVTVLQAFVNELEGPGFCAPADLSRFSCILLRLLPCFQAKRHLSGAEHPQGRPAGPFGVGTSGCARGRSAPQSDALRGDLSESPCETPRPLARSRTVSAGSPLIRPPSGVGWMRPPCSRTWPTACEPPWVTWRCAEPEAPCASLRRASSSCTFFRGRREGRGPRGLPSRRSRPTGRRTRPPSWSSWTASRPFRHPS